MKVVKRIKTPYGNIIIYGKAILLFALFSSCSATWHIKRAKAKQPELFTYKETLKIDTLIKEVATVDTVFKQKTDTLIQFVQKDSIHNEVIIRYKYNTLTDSVFIEVDCPDNEVITKEVIKTQTVEIKPSLWEKFLYFFMGVALLYVILVVIRLTRE